LELKYTTYTGNLSRKFADFFEQFFSFPDQPPDMLLFLDFVYILYAPDFPCLQLFLRFFTQLF